MIHDLRPYPAMKDSGVPWLGQVPEHWDIKRGKSLFKKLDRPVTTNAETVTCFRDGLVTLRKNRRLRGFTEALKEIGYQGVKRGDLVIHAMDAFAGAVGVSDSDGKATPVYAVCAPLEPDDSVPMYYAFTVREMARNEWILALSRGIRERSTDFRFETFGMQLLPAPPLPEQAAIVRFLDHADRRIRKAIAAKQRLIRLLQEQKQVIIHQAVTRGLDPNVKLKPSGVEWLGDVPEGWSILKIGYFAKVGNGSTPSRGNALYWTDGSYPWLNSSIVNHGKVTVANQFITHQALQECHLPIVPPGSVLVAITGQGKTRGKAATLDIEATINQHIAYITPRPNSGVTAEYLQSFLSAAYGELRRLSDDSGSTKGALTCDALKNFKIAVPPVLEQTQLLQHIREASASADFAITHAQREISLLREYRTRLIADVVTGKLNVRAAAARLPEQEPDAMPEELEGGEAGDSELEADEREAELVEA